MIHNPSPDFQLFDEALLNCTDGHCLFDNNGKLLSWSQSFSDFYPKIRDRIRPGYPYAQFIRDLLEQQALKNLKSVKNVDKWIEKQVSRLDENPEFVHHLEDGRFMKIRYAKLSNGYWFFVASDVTASVLQREALEESVKRQEGFAQISADWFWELDSELRYVYFSRIDHMLRNAELNTQCYEHNDALLAHETVESVLTWDDGDVKKHVQMIGEPQYNKDGEFTGYVGCAKDVTTEYGLKQQLEFQAAHDELTGLINRRAFGNYLNISLDNFAKREAENKSYEDLHQTLIFVDLDQFKMVNDNAGHQAGDQLLVDVTRIFGIVYSDPNDIIARLGGDEFAILSSYNEAQAKEQTEKLIRLIGEYRFKWDERTFTIGASAGIVLLDDSTSDDSDLLSKADTACYSAKISGRNQVHLFSRHSVFESNKNDEIGKLELINDSLLHERMSLALQPIVPSSRIDDHSKFEVLLRLEDATRQVVPPGIVIPVAEKYDRMQHLDLWIIERAIEAIKKFSELDQSVALSVNLSGNTLSNEACLDQIARLVELNNVKPKTLCFEVTETATIKRIEKACGFIEHLKQFGCEFSLDDFGSGLSSFSYLRSLPVDYLKIDGCFVADIEEDLSNRAIVTSFNMLAHELGMKTVAEYVETEEIAELLGTMGIDYLQGFGVGAPQSLDAWLQFYAESQRLTGT